MKFWTFQGLGVLLELHKNGIYKPDFTTEYYKNNCYRKNSYNYILNLYNNKFNQTNKGLIFGLSECMGNKILTLDDYKNTLKFINGWGFSSAAKETYLLELDIPVDEEILMPIDFYRFCSLIDLMDINPEDQDNIAYDNISLIEHNKIHLFESNISNIKGYENIYQLKQVHFPYTKKEYITNIYKGIEYHERESFIESDCEYLKYFKQILLK